MTYTIDSLYIKKIAYDLMLREGFTTLPINAIHSLVERHYYIRSYENIYEWDVDPEVIIRAYGDAFVYWTGCEEIPYGLGINMSCDLREKNWTIMHELAHIELGHVTDVMGAAGELAPAQWAEEEVEMLCQYVMCPDVVLKELGIKKAQDIYNLCMIPYQKAMDKEKYFRGMEYKFRSFPPIKTPTEQLLLHNFSDYINRINAYQHGLFEFSCELCF